MKAMCFIFDGFEELEFTGPVTMLNRAGIMVDVFSDKESVKGKHNITIKDVLDINNSDYTNYDMLFLPGGPHYVNFLKNKKVIDAINYFNESKKLIASICAAPTVLGKMGLLKNKKYTCFKSMNEDFGGTFIDTHVVCDNNFITGISSCASIELGYEIIRYLLGEEKLKSVQDSIFY